MTSYPAGEPSSARRTPPFPSYNDYPSSFGPFDLDLEPAPSRQQPYAPYEAPAFNVIGPTPTALKPPFHFSAPSWHSRSSHSHSHSSRSSSASSPDSHPDFSLGAASSSSTPEDAPSVDFDPFAMQRYLRAVACDPGGAYRSGLYPHGMPGYEQMLAQGQPPAAMFMGFPSMTQELYSMLQAHHVQTAQQQLSTYAAASTTSRRPSPPQPSSRHPPPPDSSSWNPPQPTKYSFQQKSSPSSIGSHVSSYDFPTTGRSPRYLVSASPLETRTNTPQPPADVGQRRSTNAARSPAGVDAFSDPTSVEFLQHLLDDIDASPSGRSVRDDSFGESGASESEGYLSSSTSTISSAGDDAGGRYANWRRPSRKRRSEDLSAATRPPVSVRTQSWGSETAPLGASPVAFNWGDFAALPDGTLDSGTGISPSSSTVLPRSVSPPTKRRKSVSDSMAAFGPSPLVAPAPTHPSSLPPQSSPWLPRSASDPHVGPFSATGMPRPPRLNSSSLYAPSVSAAPVHTGGPSPSSARLTLSPPSYLYASPRSSLSPSDTSPPAPSSAQLHPPTVQRFAHSAPGSVSDSGIDGGSSSGRLSRRAGPSRIPGSLPPMLGSTGSTMGLNPVVEVNTEWVPSRPRIRKSIRRRLEKRQVDTPRIEHVLEDTRPPPVVPAVEKPRKKGKSKAKGRPSSASASEAESDLTSGTERSASAKGGKRRVARKSRPSSGSSDEDEDTEEHEARPFEHGPTELPPRPWAGKSPLDIARKKKIPESAMDKIPLIEARMHALERAVDAHIQSIFRRTLQNTLLPGLDYPVDEMNQLWTDQGGEGAFAPRLAPGLQASSSPSAKNPAPDPDSSPLTALTPTSVGSLIVPLLSARPAVDDTGEGPMNDDDDAGVDQSS